MLGLKLNTLLLVAATALSASSASAGPETTSFDAALGAAHMVATGLDALYTATNAANVRTRIGFEYVRDTLTMLEDDWTVATTNLQAARIADPGTFADQLQDGLVSLHGASTRLCQLSSAYKKQFGAAHSVTAHLHRIQAGQAAFFKAVTSKNIPTAALEKADLSDGTFQQMADQYHAAMLPVVAAYK